MALPLRRAAALLVGAFLAGAASSQSLALERAPLPADEPPFSALGRVNAGGAGFCSGVLIAPATVLTAAHCLFNFKQKTWWPLSEIRFVAGVYRDSWVGVAGVRKVKRDTVFKLEDRHPALDELSRDWAILELDAPLGERARWFAVAQSNLSAAGQLALQAGYRRDRPYAPELSPPCRIVQTRARPALLIHDCQVPEGGSGSPLFVVEGGELKVAGVHSAQIGIARDGGGKQNNVSGVVPLSVFQTRLPPLPPAPDPQGAARAFGIALSRQIGPAQPAAADLPALMRQVYRQR